MFDLLNKKLNIKWNRRDFLKIASQTTLATLASGYPRISWGIENENSENENIEKILPRADQVILLWMAGGQAHTETFDPKTYTPYIRGNRQYKLISTFPSIDTAVDNIKFSKGLENIASVIDRGAVIRSFSPPDLGHILHSRHQFNWHTGYIPPQTVEVPHIGSMISKVMGSMNPDLPGFVHIGQRLDIDGAPEVQAFLTSGFLGGEFAPLLIPYPDQAMKKISPPAGMEMGRFENRYKIFKELVNKTPTGQLGSDYQRNSLLNAMENGYRIINSPSANAFDLSREPKEVHDQYNTGRFGLGCLLARRLIESGVRFVEVSTEHVPFGNWDTHVDGHRRTVEMKKAIDAPVARLIKDLEERKLLDRTLVIIASEFSRAAYKEGMDLDPHNKSFIMHQIHSYGLHRHFTGAGSVVMFGAGIKKGSLYGRTADEAPCQTIEDPVNLTDLHATIFHALGIPADLSFDIEKRPFYVTENGLGKPVMELFA
ncbi:MAG: DUF1501 domain-containing protein [bacterium]|nr:DUF1501 domain-containing protein [bacterium]